MKASWDISRRLFLKGLSTAAIGVGVAPSGLLVRAAEGAAPGPGVFVHVFLRGGADGLALCPPIGDSDYFSLRGGIALSRGDVINLDGYFGLHPSLGRLKSAFSDGRLALVHAVGSYGLTRSHFDAQDFMETGAPGNRSISNGWLERAVEAIPGREVTQAVSFSTQLTRSLWGGEPVLVGPTLSAFDLHARGWRGEAESGLRAMYEADASSVGQTGLETLAVINALLKAPAVGGATQNGATYPSSSVGNSLRQAAQLIRAGIGTRCIFVNVAASFDTHSRQLSANQVEFGRLGDALAAFDQDLGRLMDDVVVLVSTEFGRTAYVNGSEGTDHGSGHCALVLGGRVRGGRVYGRWPGLGKGQLYEDRDLAITTDFRDLFAELAGRQLGISTTNLFPGYTPGPGLGIVA